MATTSSPTRAGAHPDRPTGSAPYRAMTGAHGRTMEHESGRNVRDREIADCAGLGYLPPDQIRASRARIVQAADAERKRLARNLHDGAQQRLASLAHLLRLARAKVVVDPDHTEQLLQDAAVELAAALRELRELARGLHPAVLSGHGLRRALELLVERAPFPVQVDAPKHRLPEQVETAAYYIVSEALANASKHAEPTRMTVVVAREEESVSVEVRDDGKGGADIAGSGIVGLRDRAEALGGFLTVESLTGAGTTIRAVLPIADPCQ
jgi:signal transduction histidine kinase